MISTVKELYKHRQLVHTMVVRELKARYRGTVLGFLWSFLNPMLLLAVYSFVFGVLLPGSSGRVENIDIIGIDYSIFLFTGLLPWIWFSTSVLECSNVLSVYGNLIKKIKFPLEVLPIMTVITNMIHYLLGIPILIVFLAAFGKGVSLTYWALLLPVAVLLQFLFTIGLGFFVAAVTVHFKDVKDILNNLLTLWFFVTPIIYPFMSSHVQDHKYVAMALSLNPMTHIVEMYHYIFFFGKLPHYKRLGVTVLVALGMAWIGYTVFNKLRDTFSEEV